MKKIIVSIVFTCIMVSFLSCSNEDFVLQPQVSEATIVSNGPLKVTAVVDPLAKPTGWSQLYSATAAKCFKKDNTNTYVVAINLKNGQASVKPLYNTPTPSLASSTSPNPVFQTGNVLYWQGKDQTAFAVANCAFFNGPNASSQPITGEGTTTLPFVLKRFGSIVASGYNLLTESNQRYLTLGLSASGYGYYSQIGDNGSIANTGNLFTTSQNYYQNKGNTIIGGLHPINANKDATASIGRTMVGIKDCDGDGYKEALYILVASSETQSNAYNLLKNAFLCDQVVMFDGSGSSQLISKQQELVVSSDMLARRKFPVALQVIAN